MPASDIDRLLVAIDGTRSALAAEIARLRGETATSFDRLDGRIGSIANRVPNLETDEEVHKALDASRNSRRNNAELAKRWAVGIVAALVAGSIGAVVEVIRLVTGH